jgi:hypothetical protein
MKTFPPNSQKGKWRVLNEKTGRWVMRTGPMGRKIVAMKKAKRQTPQVPSNAKQSKITKQRLTVKKPLPKCSPKNPCYTAYDKSMPTIKTTKQWNKLREVKPVKNGGQRLSASYYFNVLCGGKMKKCRPQPILQPSGAYVMKQVRIVNGKSGPEPRWVKVD